MTKPHKPAQPAPHRAADPPKEHPFLTLFHALHKSRDLRDDIATYERQRKNVGYEHTGAGAVIDQIVRAAGYKIPFKNTARDMRTTIPAMFRGETALTNEELLYYCYQFALPPDGYQGRNDLNTHRLMTLQGFNITRENFLSLGTEYQKIAERKQSLKDPSEPKPAVEKGVFHGVPYWEEQRDKEKPLSVVLFRVLEHHHAFDPGGRGITANSGTRDPHLSALLKGNNTIQKTIRKPQTSDQPTAHKIVKHKMDPSIVCNRIRTQAELFSASPAEILLLQRAFMAHTNPDTPDQEKEAIISLADRIQEWAPAGKTACGARLNRALTTANRVARTKRSRALPPNARFAVALEYPLRDVMSSTSATQGYSQTGEFAAITECLMAMNQEAVAQMKQEERTLLEQVLDQSIWTRLPNDQLKNDLFDAVASLSLLAQQNANMWNVFPGKEEDAKTGLDNYSLKLCEKLSKSPNRTAAGTTGGHAARVTTTSGSLSGPHHQR